MRISDWSSDVCSSDLQLPHAGNIGLTLGDRDHPPRVQQVEQMACFDRMVIGRKRQFRRQQFLALLLRFPELVEQEIGLRMLEIIGGELTLTFKKDIAIAEDRKSTRLNSSH